MKLNGVDVGDIIEADVQGRRFFAVVTGRDAEGLRLRPITRETWRHVTARQVVGIYRKAKGSR
jgi:hypothetical protein